MENLINFDIQQFIATIGYAGIFAIVFAESGLLIGFFLPGDSLLFTAGAIAGSTVLQDKLGIKLSYPVLAMGCFVAAVAGDSVGYWFGHRVGRRLFQREDSLLFKKKYLYQAEALYQKHGGRDHRHCPVYADCADVRAHRRRDWHCTTGVSSPTTCLAAYSGQTGVVTAGYLLGQSCRRLPDADYYHPLSSYVLPPAVHVLRDVLAERRARKAAQDPPTVEPDHSA